MLALFRNIQTNEPQAISRTFLDHEARKDSRARAVASSLVP